MNEKSKRPEPSEATHQPEEITEGERVVESVALLGVRGQLVIRHEGRLYRLRRTRLGKLILTA